MREDENIYVREDDGTYKPVGIHVSTTTLVDGIWYVRHHDYGRGMTNVKYLEGLFKLGDPCKLSIPEICGLQDVVEYVENCDEYKQLMKSENGVSLNDIISLTVAKAYEKMRSNN